jgi:CheY-like chemotaxis protein
MNPARILIVEDEAILAAHLALSLGQMGYQTAGQAATGEAAVALALKEKPDAILMDIRLRGEMTGIQAAEAIHKISDIPIIYLTAYASRPRSPKPMPSWPSRSASGSCGPAWKWPCTNTAPNPSCAV